MPSIPYEKTKSHPKDEPFASFAVERLMELLLNLGYNRTKDNYLISLKLIENSVKKENQRS